MSLPSSTNGNNGQSSIRNFFRPKQPVFAAPPPPPASSSSLASKTENKQNHDVLSSASTAPPPPPPLPVPTSLTTPITSSNATAQLATATPPSRPANLHPQASIECVRPEHIPALRRITSLLLPVNYPDSFYARLSDPLSSGAFSRVILWRDDKDNASAPAQVIGGLVCRPEPSPFHGGTVDPSPIAQLIQVPMEQPNALYIQSLVLLSPYRGLGLAAALLDEVITDAARSAFECESVWAHVWTENEEALKWYIARGFARVDEVKGYYHKLQPDSAWIVRRQIGPSAVLGLSPSGLSERDVNARGPSVTAAVANLSSTAPPPSSNRPPMSRTPGQSFQNMRPETEWNDLPSDMQTNLAVPGSGPSSRSSSSAGRKKRDRAYPAAAFGN